MCDNGNPTPFEHTSLPPMDRPGHGMRALRIRARIAQSGQPPHPSREDFFSGGTDFPDSAC